MCLAEHEESENCWCEPILFYEDELTGNQVWVHNCLCQGPPPAEILIQAVREAILDED
jgi:hypothetical protein